VPTSPFSTLAHAYSREPPATTCRRGPFSLKIGYLCPALDQSVLPLSTWGFLIETGVILRSALFGITTPSSLDSFSSFVSPKSSPRQVGADLTLSFFIIGSFPSRDFLSGAFFFFFFPRAHYGAWFCYHFSSRPPTPPPPRTSIFFPSSDQEFRSTKGGSTVRFGSLPASIFPHLILHFCPPFPLLLRAVLASNSGADCLILVE